MLLFEFGTLLLGSANSFFPDIPRKVTPYSLSLGPCTDPLFLQSTAWSWIQYASRPALVPWTEVSESGR
jgi:hypothetical protein